MIRVSLLVAALQTVTVTGNGTEADTRVLRPDSAALATAYLDEAARELVDRARGRREVLDASVFHYTARVRQRLSVEIVALRRDRVLYRREAAGTVEWWRDRPSRVVLEGAREAVPVAMAGVRVPEDLESWARELVVRPGDDRLWVSPSDDGFAWHPLVEGGEALYRYATGDSTEIRLPNGDTVRLVELRVTPREPDIRLVTGSFWIDRADHAVVQAVFRPSREFDLERDLPRMDPDSGEDSESEVPAVLRPIRFDARYITVEYGLWEMRWWLPRLMAFDGWLQVGPARMPIQVEVVYSDYTVEADRYGLPELPPLFIELAGDPQAHPRPFTYPTRVVVPDDTASLLRSEWLPGSLFSGGESLMTDAELRQLGERLGALPRPPLELTRSRPVVTPPWSLRHGLVRYNRVEGLSAGARVDWDLTRVRLDLTARLGAADLAPRAELGMEVRRADRTWRGAAYHRLASVDVGLRPLGLGNSISALALGRDEGMYFQATGAEARMTQAPGRAGPELRLYAERQSPVDRRTHWSLPRLLGGDGFRENIRVDPAEQLGAAVVLAAHRGGDPTGWRWSGWLDLAAETGSYTFLRPGVTSRVHIPLPARLLAALELAAGTTVGGAGRPVAPTQAGWFLGGPATLRGLPAGEIAGPDHVRGRAELASRLPGARVALFSDAGWAGRWEEREARDLGVSVGVGASLLDGLLRLDLARAVRPVERWRLELYLDALF